MPSCSCGAPTSQPTPSAPSAHSASDNSAGRYSAAFPDVSPSSCRRIGHVARSSVGSCDQQRQCVGETNQTRRSLRATGRGERTTNIASFGRNHRWPNPTNTACRVAADQFGLRAWNVRRSNITALLGGTRSGTAPAGWPCPASPQLKLLRATKPPAASRACNLPAPTPAQPARPGPSSPAPPTYSPPPPPADPSKRTRP